MALRMFRIDRRADLEETALLSKREVVVDHQRRVVRKPLLEVDVLAARLGRDLWSRPVIVTRTKNLHKFREAVRTAISAAGFEAHAPCLHGDACPPYAAKVVSGAYTGL